jgi:lactoylglutathione lyase
MTTQNLRAFAVMYSRDVPKAQRFYAELGFEEMFRMPAEGEAGYVSLRRGTADLGIVDAGWPRDQLGVRMGAEPRFELYVYVENIDATVERLGAALLKAPEDMPWGERIAYVRDPDGNPVALVVAAG